MENKYQVGITFFGIFFIAYAAYNLTKLCFNGINLLGWIGYFELVNLIVLIIIAARILYLKEQARKAIIYYSVYIVLFMDLLFFPIVFNKLAAVAVNKQYLSCFIIFSYVYFTVGVLAIIYFFTRPKVKEQFK